MFGKSKKLRRLIESVSKNDFDNFKRDIERVTEESKLVKKLYEKVMGKPIPENVIEVTMFIRYSEFLKNEVVTITESDDPTNSIHKFVSTELVFKINDDNKDILKDIQMIRYKCGNHIAYRNYVNVKFEFLVNLYLDNKMSEYDVILDSKTYNQLRLLIESTN